MIPEPAQDSGEWTTEELAAYGDALRARLAEEVAAIQLPSPESDYGFGYNSALNACIKILRSSDASPTGETE